VSQAGKSGESPERENGEAASGEIAALRAIVEGTARSTGQEFFQSLVRHLASALGVSFAFVAEFADVNTRVRTLAFWARDRIAENIEFDLDGTPCEDVVRGNLCHHPSGVAGKFPRDVGLAEMGIESYLGVPLRDQRGEVLGHLAVLDTRVMKEELRKLFIFRIFAERAAAELERLRAEKLLRENERRYRDLYEEAPIAYIYEDLESRFVRANRAATRLLGLRPEDVPDTYGVSLLAPTPETQERVRAALEGMKEERKEYACVELELRRKDDGRPIWVQWWSKPEPDGKHTRTMLVDITERVLVEREKARLEQQNLYLQEEIKEVHNFEEIVGQSGPVVDVLEKVRRVAPTDATVLLWGETGTGKELFARALHSASKRRDRPLIKVNCAALPTGLVESELFGHEKGAFSGAIQKRVGRFELANGGTIFLDEIGEIPLEVQVKLLRVLQEHEVERLGGNTPLKVDVRVIAATNRDLQQAVREGKFREDLYYRLNVFPIHLPALRERAGDIPLLVQFLLSKFAARIGKRIEGVSRQTMNNLCRYPWPGNIRELENILERAVILSGGPVLEIEPEVLPSTVLSSTVLPGKGQPASAEAPPVPSAPSPPPPVETPAAAGPAARRLPGGLEAVEREHILAILRETGWVIEGARGAARILEMHPNTLRSRIKKLGLRRSAGHEGS
jgi:PAS domain S-box-containing protein